MATCLRQHGRGRIQQLAFSKADSLLPGSRFQQDRKRDFYTFCRLDNLDAVVCEPGITAEDRTAIEDTRRSSAS